MSSAAIIVAVTGASGQVGRATVRTLLEAHHEVRVRALVRSDAKASALREALGEELASSEALEIHVGADFSKPDTVEAALRGAGRVLLIAPNSADCVELTNAASSAAARAGVTHQVLISSLDASRRKITFEHHYADIEAHVTRASGGAWTSIRAAYFLENFLSMRDSIIDPNQRAVYGSHGDGKFAAVAVDDIARLAAAVLAARDVGAHAGRTLNATGPVALSGAEYAAAISKAIGHTVTYIDLPAEHFRPALTATGLEEWQADALLELHAAYARGWANLPSSDVLHLTGRHTDAESFFHAVREYLVAAAPDASAAAPRAQ